MLALWLCLLTTTAGNQVPSTDGHLDFVKQAIREIRVDGVLPVNGQPVTNFRTVDINGDGRQDLLFAGYVVLQQGTGFSPGKRVDFPDADQPCLVDIAQRHIWRLYANRVEQATWGKEGWKRESFPLVPPLSNNHFQPETGPVLEHFLQDFNTDGIPEILVPTPEGIAIYRHSTDKKYLKAGILSCYPPFRVAFDHAQPLVSSFDPFHPVIQTSLCQVFLENTQLSVLERGPDKTEKIQFTRIDYTIQRDADNRYNVKTVEAPAIMWVPTWLYPCRLNRDNQVDFAGSHFYWAEGTAHVTPILEIGWSTDNGKTVHTLRTETFHQQTLFTDYNGDGRLDLIVERSGLHDGGVREWALRLFSTCTLTHEVRVYCQQASGRFPETPSVKKQFHITFRRPVLKAGQPFEWYKRGRCINITGDFNGDGIKDIAIENAPGIIAVFPGGKQRIASRPIARLALSAPAPFDVADIDGDGKSDLVIEPPGLEEGTVVYLARGQVP